MAMPFVVRGPIPHEVAPGRASLRFRPLYKDSDNVE